MFLSLKGIDVHALDEEIRANFETDAEGGGATVLEMRKIQKRERNYQKIVREYEV